MYSCVRAALVSALVAAPAAVSAVPSFSLSSAAIPGENNLPFDIALTNETPSINNNRDIGVAFLDIDANDGAYVTRGGAGQVLRLTGGVISTVEINDRGDAVFDEFFSTPEGIFASLDGASSATLLTPGPIGTDSRSRPQIDEQQRVGFRAGFGGFAQQYTVFESGLFTPFVATSAADPASPYSFLYTPSFNDSMQIAGKVDTGSPGAGSEQVRVFGSGGSSVLIASSSGDDPSSSFGGFDNSVSLNDSGQVAFTVRDASGPGSEDAVYIGDGSSNTLVASTLDAEISGIQFFAPRMSDAGFAAFIADDANGEEAIFAGDGTELVRVLGTGDAVDTPFGTKFVAADSLTGNIGINDRGDIAFNVIVNNADGSTFGRVIGIAAVPAPGAFAVFGLAGVAAVRRRR